MTEAAPLTLKEAAARLAVGTRLEVTAHTAYPALVGTVREVIKVQRALLCCRFANGKTGWMNWPTRVRDFRGIGPNEFEMPIWGLGGKPGPDDTDTVRLRFLPADATRRDTP